MCQPLERANNLPSRSLPIRRVAGFPQIPAGWDILLAAKALSPSPRSKRMFPRWSGRAPDVSDVTEKALADTFTIAQQRAAFCVLSIPAFNREQNMTDAGPKMGWIAGGLGGLSWIPVLAIIQLVRGNVVGFLAAGVVLVFGLL